MGLENDNLVDIPLIDLNSEWNSLSDSRNCRPHQPISAMLSPGGIAEIPATMPPHEDVSDDALIGIDQQEANSANSSRERKNRRVSVTRQHLHLTGRQRSLSPNSNSNSATTPNPNRNSNSNFNPNSNSNPDTVPPSGLRDEPEVFYSDHLSTGEAGEAGQRVQPCCSAEVDRMKWRIKFFFMDPIQKWKSKHQFPWKLFLQVIKIVFVTIQLVMLGNERYAFATFLNQNTVSFRHLFLLKWNDPDIPVQVYPNSGLYACYQKKEVFQKMDFAINQFRDLRNIAIGSYSHASVVEKNARFRFCKREFINATLIPENYSYVYDSGIKETCLPIDLPDSSAMNFSMKTFLAEKDESIVFDRLVDAKLFFGVQSVALDPSDPDDTPDCYLFEIVVRFDNAGHNGQIQVDLEIDPHVLPCNGKMLFEDSQSVWDILVDVLDASVLVICIMSLLLCLRALYNADTLKKTVVEFFQNQYGAVLTREEQLEFLNLWYVMIVVNDVLTICGTVIKLRISTEAITELPLYNACGMLLGVGNLLVWVGVLRYLGFFRTYNILILTFKRAIPNVLRYLACIVLIFCGFSFCGWIVLGPYHLKFQTFHSTTETIFSLINGDDMFATFAIFPWQNTLIWYFSRVYLYTFICIFTYVVLSLMISLIMDAYGTVKDFYEQGGPSSRLNDFINEPVFGGVSSECARHRAHGSFASFDAAAWNCRRSWCSCFEWLRKKTRRRGDDFFETASDQNSWVPHQRMQD